jgi:hypothetical protein
VPEVSRRDSEIGFPNPTRRSKDLSDATEIYKHIERGRDVEERILPQSSSIAEGEKERGQNGGFGQQKDEDTGRWRWRWR